MPLYRRNLPQLADRLFLTDGGIETTLIYLENFELPHFAAFILMATEEGRAALKRYYARHAGIAVKNSAGFILESPTWRANPDWAARLGYSNEALDEANRAAIDLMVWVRHDHETVASPIVISGCIGPRGDGYKPDALMTAWEAEAYHARQIRTFQATEADMVTAITMNYADEAIGIARAAADAAMPVAISFTVETDGRLATGQPLGDAIEMVDDASARTPAYYMINCAHPDHFDAEIARGGGWLDRIRGIRANASRRSHAELDAATELDAGDPEELGRLYADLRRRRNTLSVLGGCCGTDHRHIGEICLACTEVAA